MIGFPLYFYKELKEIPYNEIIKATEKGILEYIEFLKEEIEKLEKVFNSKCFIPFNPFLLIA